MSKRDSPNDSDSLQEKPGSPKRQRLVVFEPVRLPAVSTVSELDQKILAFQNRKLEKSLLQKNRTIGSLQRRIDQLELRQTQDDALLCIVNRHWNRLDEDVRILLQRFDAETGLESETENEAKATSSFLTALSQWDKPEVDNRLLQRVEFSRRVIGKLVQAFDRITQRNEKIGELLKEAKGGDDAEGNRPESDQAFDGTKLNEAVIAMNAELNEECRRAQTLATEMQEKNHKLSMNHSELEEQLNAAETKVEELKAQIEDSKYELTKAENSRDKYEQRLVDMAESLSKLEDSAPVTITTNKDAPSASGTTNSGGSTTVGNGSGIGKEKLSKISKNQLEELSTECEEHKELAGNRLQEMQELHDKYKGALKEIQMLRMDLVNTPKDVVIQTQEYKCLQSQFSVLYNESVQMRNQLEDVRGQLITAKTAHLKQIEQMEAEELLAQKQLRAEMIELEEQLSQVRREYETLRLEFEQNLAANEQTGPLNKEMRQLLASCKTQNQQLKTETMRFKKKWKEAVNIIAKLQKDLDEERSKHPPKPLVTSSSSSSNPTKELSGTGSKSTPMSPGEGGGDQNITQTTEEGEILKSPKSPCSEELEAEQDVAKLKERVRALTKKLEDCSKKQLDKDKVGTFDRRLKEDNEHLRAQLAGLEAKLKTAISMEEYNRKVRQMEQNIELAKKQLDSAKSEEEVLLNEMEVTGQAFEDMQEQNLRLVQQLREKEDANFKLMSERIRSNQQGKIRHEEKELITKQVVALQSQVEAQNFVVRKLEEKERLLQTNVATVEKELSMRQQTLELHKRKALEASQSAADLKLQLEKVQSQLSESQSLVVEKTATLEQESFKILRFKEEISVLKRKIERAKKMERGGTADEVLLEEIRELKEHLTCPSCKVRRKDGVLTKCQHVFCMECLRSRYETRQRKCPKCNAQFGANDFKRIYIT